MRTLLPCICLCLALSLPALVSAAEPVIAPSAADHVAHVGKAVFALVILEEDPLGKKAPTLEQKGTAFLAPQGVVTCAHAVQSIPARHFFPVSHLGVLVPSDKAFQAAKAAGKTSFGPLDRHEFVALSLQALDPVSDIALLQPASKIDGILPLPMGGDRPALGAEILVVSQGTNEVALQVSRGIVSGRSTVEPLPGRQFEILRSTMLCPVGVSGAPVFDGITGSVIGMAKGFHRLLGRTLNGVPGLAAADLCVPVILPLDGLDELAKTGN